MSARVEAVCLTGTKKNRRSMWWELRVDHVLSATPIGKWHRRSASWPRKHRWSGTGISVGSGVSPKTSPPRDRVPSLRSARRWRREALVESTQIGKECHSRCAIYRLAGDCVMPRDGIFAKVLRGGVVKPGDSLSILREVEHS